MPNITTNHAITYTNTTTVKKGKTNCQRGNRAKKRGCRSVIARQNCDRWQQ